MWWGQLRGCAWELPCLPAFAPQGQNRGSRTTGGGLRNRAELPLKPWVAAHSLWVVGTGRVSASWPHPLAWVSSSLGNPPLSGEHTPSPSSCPSQSATWGKARAPPRPRPSPPLDQQEEEKHRKAPSKKHPKNEHHSQGKGARQTPAHSGRWAASPRPPTGRSSQLPSQVPAGSCSVLVLRDLALGRVQSVGPLPRPSSV